MSFSETPLRPSLFARVPPFLNFLPSWEASTGAPSARATQYWDVDGAAWDQDQLWRVPMLASRALDNWDRVEREDRQGRNSYGNRRRSCVTGGGPAGSQRSRRSTAALSMVLSPDCSLDERPDDALVFKELHPGVRTSAFPRLHQVARKDQLADNLAQMSSRFEGFDFHPETFVLPRDRAALTKAVVKSDPKKDMFIVKPPNSNNGRGVRAMRCDIKCIPTSDKPYCVQRYIPRPLLIRGCKFDIRVYVLLTSLDPLTVYLYEDGLVRMATEKYSDNPRSAAEDCVHVTNFAVNRGNGDKFAHSTSVNACDGHKWRLKRLWTYLHELGYQEHDITSTWAQVEDIVVKSLLCAHTSMLKDFRAKASKSAYNAYKLLGYDLLLDQDMKVHLIEINARPALLDDDLDRAVNRPMMEELFRIVGFHLPVNCAQFFSFIRRMLPAPKIDKNNNNVERKSSTAVGRTPLAFERRLYTRSLTKQEEYKQQQFKEDDKDRSKYCEQILKEMLSCDVRVLVKLEEELSQLKQFNRLFPTADSHKYFQFMDRVTYYDKVADAYETMYSSNREAGRDMLDKLCQNNWHM